MDRQRAQELVAEIEIEFLSDKEVSEILSEYWVYDTEDEVREDIINGELPELSEDIISFLVTSRLPEKPNRVMLKSLIMDMQVYMLNLVLNSYLEEKLKFHGYNVMIEGGPEKAGLCPCCNYYSIKYGDDGFHDICPICGWQNGGDSPNHMSIKVAQKNFVEFSARAVDLTPKVLKQEQYQVNPEELKKYKKQLKDSSKPTPKDGAI